MLLENNTKRVMNLVDIVDDLNGIDKVRLSIHLLEENCFSTNYDDDFIIVPDNTRVVKPIINDFYEKDY